jgi:hypothetical protein
MEVEKIAERKRDAAEHLRGAGVTQRQNLASDYESGGRKFESFRARQLFQWLIGVPPF